MLAAVQAFVLRELYNTAAAQEPPQVVDIANVRPEAATDALVRALAHIIWSARVGRVASVVNCKTTDLPSLRACAGELSVTQCGSSADVLSALRSFLGSYTRANGPGIALLLYSLTLTRGIAMVGQDADFPTQLIAANGYCSQELVNLILIGRGHSNVFDGEQTVSGQNDGKGDGRRSTENKSNADGGFRLGPPRRALVGFLTLFEKQGYSQNDTAHLRRFTLQATADADLRRPVRVALHVPVGQGREPAGAEFTQWGSGYRATPSRRSWAQTAVTTTRRRTSRSSLQMARRSTCATSIRWPSATMR